MSDSPRHEWPLRLSRRVRVTGRLRMTSALHVGGGVGTTSMTDAGVVRHADGRPFIPGSSLKGALRSHVERLCQTEALAGKDATSCLLYAPEEESPSWTPTAPNCPTPPYVATNDEDDVPSPTDLSEWAKERVDTFLDDLCCTCTLFGSPYLAGKIRIPDLEVDEQTFDGQVEIRDGVGIDRDRGRAVPKVKFDYEVIPAETVFEFALEVDSPDTVELGLVAIAIRELQRGYVSVGGNTTRGLGHCELGGVEIEDTQFRDFEQVATYFKHRTDAGPPTIDDPEQFLDEQIAALLEF